MSQQKIPGPDAGYTVGLLPETAFTVFYDDGLGRLIFVFEVTRRDLKTIHLDPRPSQDGQMVDASDQTTVGRVDLAISRVKAYFERQGMSVHVDD